MSPSPRGAVRSVCAIPLTAPPHATRAALVGLLSVLVGCAGDHTIMGPDGVAREGMIVSHPVPPPALSPRGGRAAAAAASASGDSVVYASLVPKTVPTGVTATVRALTSGATVTTAIQDGGFDPVALTAKVGDSVTTVVVDGTDSVLFRAAAAVTPIRRISVIRTDPGSGKRDQPLNANIVIVFSGPVDVTTLTASVQLFNGTTSIPGTVSLLAGSPTTAVFSPSRPLDQNTDYRLVVTTGVEDITGGSLDADIAVTFTTGTTMVLPASTVTVSPDTSALAIAWQGQLTAVARDTIGTLIVGRPFNWTSDNPVVATVSAGGLVTALAEGVAHVQAEMDGRSALATIQVSVALAPVASVAVVPGSAKLVVGGFVEVSAEPRDAAGNLLPFRAITWQSSNPTVATVSAGTGSTAIVTDVAAGTATITASTEGHRGTATITTGTVGPYTQVLAADHTCALAADASASCWGSGDLGNGTELTALVPVAVAGSLRFSQVGSTCALKSDGLAYCWGVNYLGQLGNGGSAGSLVPVPVSGARLFSSIDGRGDHRCALTSSGAAYCWGDNGLGQLGVGTAAGPNSCGGEACSTVPVPVTGGLTFTHLAVGDSHTCGLTASGFTYCWGRGDAGTMGNGSRFDQSAPVIALGPVFVALSAGAAHTCGLTSDGSAYCWGDNDDGQLGVGSTTGPESPCISPVAPGRGPGNCSTIPVQVTGGLRFRQISAGGQHTCAVTATGTAYCWGSDWASQLGNGSSGSWFPTPVAVSGGLAFVTLSAGGDHSCGLTSAGVVYCWGSNGAGQLGSGSTKESNAPVRVAGQP